MRKLILIFAVPTLHRGAQPCSRAEGGKLRQRLRLSLLFRLAPSEGPKGFAIECGDFMRRRIGAFLE